MIWFYADGHKVKTKIETNERGEAQQQQQKKTWSKAECVHIVHTVTHTLTHVCTDIVLFATLNAHHEMNTHTIAREHNTTIEIGL